MIFSERISSTYRTTNTNSNLNKLLNALKNWSRHYFRSNPFFICVNDLSLISNLHYDIIAVSITVIYLMTTYIWHLQYSRATSQFVFVISNIVFIILYIKYCIINTLNNHRRLRQTIPKIIVTILYTTEMNLREV